MAGELRFDGKVVLVTGAGNGLGKAYALEFGRRGAKVVVNDLGVTARGEGKDSKAADAVVNEIKAAGGSAVADYNSVVDGAKIVKTAIDAFGRVDVIINNAGILRDVSFAKMTDQDWKLLNDVHLSGAYSVAKAAWDGMRERKYGRIINVSSAAGLYGNFGQAHYSAVKMGIVGLSNTLSIEGKKLNIHCNVIAPVAGSRMTETIMPPDLVKALKPEYVSPLVLYLCHDSCKETGGIFEVGAGWMSKLRWERTKGHLFPLNESFTPDAVRDSFAKITDFSVDPQYPTSPQDAFGQIMANLEAAKSGGAAGAPAAAAPKGGKGKKAGKKDADSSVDPALVLSHKFADSHFTYTEKDAILYAIGVGAGATAPTSDAELKYTYENHPDFQVVPSFGVVAAGNILLEIMTIQGLKFNPMMLLHGEQYLEVRKPIAARGTLVNKNKVAGIYDKGKGALLLIDVNSKDAAGDDVFYNQYSLFIRGAGGFGGAQNTPPPTNEPPQRPPDVVHREPTVDSQALLYRLTGDVNPLHADPAMAAMGGFNKPILHGLCSFGFAVRAVIKHFANNDASLFKSVRVRFVKHVFPGETLITEMWKVSPTTIIFRVKVAERGEYVLGNAAVELRAPVPGSAPVAAVAEVKAAAPAPTPAPAAAAPAGGAKFKAEAIFAELKKRADPELVKKVGVIYRFDLSAGGVTRSWLVDLKNGSGSVSETKSDTAAECAIIISDADFVELMAGKLNAQNAFMKGQIKIKGNMMLAQKLKLLSSAPQAKL